MRLNLYIRLGKSITIYGLYYIESSPNYQASEHIFSLVFSAY